jgi:hypothetical protein
VPASVRQCEALSELAVAEQILCERPSYSIGFAWHPATSALYRLEKGVDTFGDNEQPEELNRIEVGRNTGGLGQSQRPADICSYRACCIDADRIRGP